MSRISAPSPANETEEAQGFKAGRAGTRRPKYGAPLTCARSGKDPSASAWSTSRSALQNASRTEELKFRLLRARDLSPVNYKRVAQVDGKEVPWNEIVKGYEYEKDKFVVLKDEDFKRVDLEATDTIDIVDFVDLAQINPMYFYKPYYLEPLKGGRRPPTTFCARCCSTPRRSGSPR